MIDKTRLPRHIAIIMDGNGRWAKKRHLPKAMGHRAGAQSVDVVTTECAKLGIEALTLYSFSTENWKRSQEEIDNLMNLLLEFLDKKRQKLLTNNVRLRTIGQIERLPEAVQKKISEVEAESARNTGLIMNLALSYGSREEITRAAHLIAEEVKNGALDAGAINEETVSSHLYTAGLPEPDLLIRTSGEMRLSNFLLWQLSYAEIYVTDKLWPDFRIKDLHKAVEEYQKRERKFGA